MLQLRGLSWWLDGRDLGPSQSSLAPSPLSRRPRPDFRWQQTGRVCLDPSNSLACGTTFPAPVGCQRSAPPPPPRPATASVPLPQEATWTPGPCSLTWL